MTWIVIVTDHRNATLTGASAVNYESPLHREADARKLVELLNAGAASGEGPRPSGSAHAPESPRSAPSTTSSPTMPRELAKTRGMKTL